MARKRKIGSVALTLRLPADVHQKLENSAEIQGWTITHLIARLVYHAAPMDPANVHDARLIAEDLKEWAAARRMATAKAQAAAIIAAARKAEKS